MLRRFIVAMMASPTFLSDRKIKGIPCTKFPQNFLTYSPISTKVGC